MKVKELIDCLDKIDNKELQVQIELEPLYKDETEEVIVETFSDYIFDVPSLLRYEVSSISENRAKKILDASHYVEETKVSNSEAILIKKKETKVYIINKIKGVNV